MKTLFNFIATFFGLHNGPIIRSEEYSTFPNHYLLVHDGIISKEMFMEASAKQHPGVKVRGIIYDTVSSGTVTWAFGEKE